MKSIRSKLGIGLAATAALTILPMSAAMALPIRGVGGDTGVVVKPVAPPVLPPASQALTSFTVTTDSVVATANVQYSGSASLVTVRWGDNTSSSWNPNSPVVTLPQQTPGNLVFKHEYAIPTPDSAPFTRIATVSLDHNGTTDTDSRVLTVTPRFQVTQYQAYFSYVDHCDSFAESYSEWKIVQSMDGHDVQSWRQDRLTNNGIIPARDFQVLAGSQVSRQLTMASDQHFYVNYHVTELDPIWDDDAGTRSIDLYPGLGTRHVLLRFNDLSDCRAEIKADVDVSLLRPGLSTGGPLATMG
jgi:hypothetical protein